MRVCSNTETSLAWSELRLAKTYSIFESGQESIVKRKSCLSWHLWLWLSPACSHSYDRFSENAWCRWYFQQLGIAVDFLHRKVSLPKLRRLQCRESVSSLTFLECSCIGFCKAFQKMTIVYLEVVLLTMSRVSALSTLTLTMRSAVQGGYCMYCSWLPSCWIICRQFTLSSGSVIIAQSFQAWPDQKGPLWSCVCTVYALFMFSVQVYCLSLYIGYLCRN